MLQEKLVLYEAEDQISYVTLNRPDKLNALNAALRGELEAAFLQADEDQDTKVVVLRGAGRSFCVGFDIEGGEPEKDPWRHDALKWHEVLSGGVHTLMMPWYMKKPVIASVQGYAVGGGSELAMFCDLVVASETAKFGEPEVRFSQAGPAFVLPHLVGQKRARELLYFGDMISAKKAYEYGLINRLVSEDGDLQAETRKYAERLALIDIETLTTIKRAFVRSADISGFKDSIHAGLDLVAPLYAAKTEVNSQFVQIAREDGLREALKWRNSQFEEK